MSLIGNATSRLADNDTFSLKHLYKRALTAFTQFSSAERRLGPPCTNMCAREEAHHCDIHLI